MTFKYIGCPIL